VSGVPAGTTSTLSPPRTASARPSSSPVSLSPPSHRKAAWMLPRRIVDHPLPADSIAEFSVHSPARQSTVPVLLAVSLVCACLLFEAAVLRGGGADLYERYFVHQAVRLL